MGLEPTTSWILVWRSTNWAIRKSDESILAILRYTIIFIKFNHLYPLCTGCVGFFWHAHFIICSFRFSVDPNKYYYFCLKILEFEYIMSETNSTEPYKHNPDIIENRSIVMEVVQHYTFTHMGLFYNICW